MMTPFLRSIIEGRKALLMLNTPRDVDGVKAVQVLNGGLEQRSDGGADAGVVDQYVEVVVRG